MKDFGDRQKEGDAAEQDHNDADDAGDHGGRGLEHHIGAVLVAPRDAHRHDYRSSRAERADVNYTPLADVKMISEGVFVTLKPMGRPCAPVVCLTAFVVSLTGPQVYVEPVITTIAGAHEKENPDIRHPSRPRQLRDLRSLQTPASCLPAGGKAGRRAIGHPGRQDGGRILGQAGPEEEPGPDNRYARTPAGQGPFRAAIRR